MMNRSRKRSIVYAIRDYPFGCGTHESHLPHKIPSLDHDLVAAPRPYGTSLKQEPELKNSDRSVIVAAPKPQGTCLKQDSEVKNSVHDCGVAAPTPKGTCLKQEPAPKLKGTCSNQEAAFRSSHQHVPLVVAPKSQGTCLKQDTGFNNSVHDCDVAAPTPKGTCLNQEPGFKTSAHDCDVAASTPKRTCLKQEPAFRKSLHDRVLAAPKSKGASFKQEAAYRSPQQHDPSPREQLLEVKNYVHDPEETCLKEEPVFRNDHVLSAPKLKGTSSKQESDQHDPTTRETVLEVLHLFKEVFKHLDRDKQARRLGGDLFDATARIDIRTLAVLENMGKQVNTEKRIGLVPGINVGDEFQYKTELRLVGLHFKTMCGIDYMTVGDVKLATSIVASEGYGYSDKFGAGIVVYTGEGGNVVSKEKKTEDQRLVKGNLALANSMKKRSLVRVIRGEERLDHKGKRYVYDGLYLVDSYWLEKEVRGTTVYKFKLCRVPSQPALT